MDQPAPLAAVAPTSASEKRAAAVQALMDLGADYLTAARTVSRVAVAVQVAERMISL